jgi:phospho-N-acetylmuramoyl-pentapeptide-transferase
MSEVLGAGVLASFLTVLLGGKFIGFLHVRAFGQHIREEGPQSHKIKQGTPTMGGLLILSVTTVAFLAFGERTAVGLTVLIVTLACAGIGFLDDFAKIRNRRSLGLSGRYKLALMVPITVFIGVMADREDLSTRVFLPLLDVHVELGPVWYVLVFCVLAGATNAVNLTDGLDGLAAGTMAIAALCYTAMAVVGWIVLGDVVRLDIAIFCAALLGGCIGFLWYNSFPADVFMGDTGSLGLGGALAALAVFTKTELLLVLIGGIFVAEALSVIIQVISFQRFGRRVFLIAPIHHHFEMKAWSETKIIVRFWILASLCAGAAFVLYYLRFDQYS